MNKMDICVGLLLGIIPIINPAALSDIMFYVWAGVMLLGCGFRHYCEDEERKEEAALDRAAQVEMYVRAHGGKPKEES